MPKREPFTTPCALRRPDAALHVGVSPAHFDNLVKPGHMPSLRLLGGVKVWSRRELERCIDGAPPLDDGATAPHGSLSDLE
jgi:predicted DNA-binding transcriptional regulator AlpA